MASAGHEKGFSFETVSELREHFRWSAGRPTAILAHRRAPTSGYPENCIATFLQALAARARYVEVDIRTTSDGAFVLNHDTTLDRCTTGTGELAKHTLEELQQLHLRDSAGSVTSYHMPTFAELIEWARGRTVLFLDIKGGAASV